MRIAKFLSVLICVSLVSCFPTAGKTNGDLWSIQATPNPRLGLAFPGSNLRHYGLLADLGIGVVRLSASWALLEPKEGQHSFAGLDGRIRALQALDITPFLTFESNADWAVHPNQPVKNATPRDMLDWANFVRRTVERYDGDGIDDMPGLITPVLYFQVANEFNSPTNRSGGWAGTHAELVEYINTAHDAAKQASSSATFILGGIAAFNADILLLDQKRASFNLQQKWSATSKTVFDPASLQSSELRDLIDERFLRVLRDAQFDFASVHLYGPENRDTLRLQLVQDLAQKPVLSSECGGPSLDYDAEYSGHAHFRAVLERNLNVQVFGASFCLWFGLGEGISSTFGNSRVQIYDNAAREKPGAVAFRLLASLLPPDATVTQPVTGFYSITNGQKTACISTNSQAHKQAQETCSSPALCVTDAARKQAIEMDATALSNNCPDTAIGFSGELFWAALENGN